MVELVKRAACGPDYPPDALKGKKIAALGLAYKPNVDDLRESPAIDVVRLLQEQGAKVKAWEPYKPDADLKGIDMASALDGALQDAELIILLVAHSEFTQLKPADIAGKTRARLVVDAVNAWDEGQWNAAGFEVTRLGVRDQ